MNIFKIYTRSLSMLADTLTPVSIYLKLRDVYAGSILLESSDYHGRENSFSFICCDPLASFKVQGLTVTTSFPDGSAFKETITERSQALVKLDAFRDAFVPQRSQMKYISCGLFGYMAYDAVQYFEDITLDYDEKAIPEIFYKVYRYVIVIDHFSNELVLYENVTTEEVSSQIEQLKKIIFSNRFSTYSFSLLGDELSNLTDHEYLELVEKGLYHCNRGDVFQIVLSRQFNRNFKGDEFNVYRALRSINPSPYLFYFDFGNFKIFGSSPEAQIQIKGRDASIYPIAGTCKRTGNDKEDASLASQLLKDKKESAEHVMLVDLARNDLSRSASEVNVEVYKEIQYYSHVIHLVSKITGKLVAGASPLRLAADTFPAGTLSGAPKHKAMNLINQYENTNRGFYGGAIGYLGFNGDFNHAIMIRTFLSRENQLTYQAGAGVVAQSIPESELQEVNNKMRALRKALVLAEKL